jgi:two-component system, OmpR family, lantibiotic biosynthesis sensor histidine kinase NisK/SpaK
MEKIKNLSLKSTIILYMALALFVSSTLSFSVNYIAKNIQEDVWFQYVDKEEYMESIRNENGSNYLTVIPRISSKYMDKKEIIIVEICDIIETWGGLFLSFISCTIAVLFFYKNKLSIPLKELSKASKKISENELNFEIQYSSKDEIGNLCRDFDKMRKELSKHKRKMWNMIEDEKILRAAIAHDIRTPITIVKGNLEIVEEFLPIHKISESKALELVGKTMHHLDHLECFVEMMRNLNSIIDIEPNYNKMTYNELASKVYDVLKMLCKNKNIEFEFYHNDINFEVFVDPVFIMEVEENLLNNALRFVKNKIELSLKLEENNIILVIEDDGEGFHESSRKILQSYCKNKGEKGEIHYGLGLYISKTLCNNHLGDLILDNRNQGGAIVTAKFGVENNMLKATK